MTQQVDKQFNSFFQMDQWAGESKQTKKPHHNKPKKQKKVIYVLHERNQSFVVKIICLIRQESCEGVKNQVRVLKPEVALSFLDSFWNLSGAADLPQREDVHAEWSWDLLGKAGAPKLWSMLKCAPVPVVWRGRVFSTGGAEHHSAHSTAPLTWGCSVPFFKVCARPQAVC